MAASPGRHRTIITAEDFIKEPTEIMEYLAYWKNNELLSWQTMAEELNNEVSPSLLRQVCLGHCNSPKIERLLGFRKRQYRRCAFFGTNQKGKKRAQRWDEISKQWDGLTGLVNGIMDGEIIVSPSSEVRDEPTRI